MNKINAMKVDTVAAEFPDSPPRKRKPGTRLAKKHQVVVYFKDGQLVNVYASREDIVCTIINEGPAGGFVFKKDNTNPDDKVVTWSQNPRNFLDKLRIAVANFQMFAID